MQDRMALFVAAPLPARLGGGGVAAHSLTLHHAAQKANLTAVKFFPKVIRQ
jgi:hypothetical protein